MKETIITWTSLKGEDYLKAKESPEFGKLRVVKEKIKKADKPELGMYVLDNGDSAIVYTVREVDVAEAIEALSDKEKAKHLEDGFRVKALHAPAHAFVKSSLGIVKESNRAVRDEAIRQKTLNELIQNLVDTGMSREKAVELLMPKA